MTIDDDPYWREPCVCCRAEDRNRTNLECVTEAARNTGTPLEQAKILFRKQGECDPVPEKYMNWIGIDKAEHSGGQP